ncbi:MAG: mechanosensitive ion channel family protein [Tannerella sp.]|jgi:small-conductance mechanosensitive channel|nr:mechanosensitive ion channel family protein [Tannerella sp.]
MTERREKKGRRIVQLWLFTAAMGTAVMAVAQLPADDFSRADLLPADSMLSKTMNDSLRIEALMLQIREMELREIMLRTELDNVHHAERAADSIKITEQRRQIDSLRAVTPAVPVVVGQDTLFTIYARQGGLTPRRRAENVQEQILETGKDLTFGKDSLRIENGMSLTDLMYGEKVIFSITDQDACWEHTTRDKLAEQYRVSVSRKIDELKRENGLAQWFKHLGLFLLVILLQAGLFYLTNRLFLKLRHRILLLEKQKKLKPLFVIRDYEVLNTSRQEKALLVMAKGLKWVLILLQLVFSVPMLFAIFPQTQSFAETLFLYIFEPLKLIFWSIIHYIPNLFRIIVIFLCIHYLVKGIRYIACEIEHEKLKINGFFPDWAQPTFNIVRFFLYAFMIAMIYNYLPYSNSVIFKGMSVFVGLMVSLGSTTVIGNILAGFVITYMRPFKTGDRIKLNDTEGHVIEKSPFVTRLRTPKNEIVTIPNSQVMSSNITNHSSSAKIYGLIIHTEVGFGFNVPRQQVCRLLIRAALETPCVLDNPKPFVLETELKDSYPVYQINACVKEVDNLPTIYSELHRHIHDVFQEAGIELVLPHYYAGRDGNPIAMPPEYPEKHPPKG